MDIRKILRELESERSRNAKKDILIRNECETLKKFFLYAYNERWVYGIGLASIRPYKETKVAQSESGPKQNVLFGASSVPTTESKYADIFELLDELKKHPFGSNEDVSDVNAFLSTCDEEEYYWYTRLILKNLKIGCSAKTINEVYKDLIPTFVVMLAHPHTKHIHKVRGKDFQLQKKLDGFRMIVYFDPEGHCRFFTRSGVELFNFPQIEEEFKTKFPRMATTIVYDGEVIANDAFNDTQKLVLRHEPKTGLIFNVFDRIPLAEWESGQSTDTLFDRYDILSSMFSVAVENGGSLKNIQLVEELYRGNEFEQIAKWFDHAKSMSWEGIMLKLDSVYVRKRSDTMLKFKEFDTIDLKVVRVNQGTGKFENTLGSVTVEYKGNQVSVGSGFDDYARAKFWHDPNLIIDKTIEIQYFEESFNESGQKSLRFPVFKRIREDK